jgi:hypothetical protein
MKKLFSALFFLLIGSYAFSSNGIKQLSFNYAEATGIIEKSYYEGSSTVNIEDENFIWFDHCTIRVEKIDSDGNVTDSVEVTNYEGDCEAAKRAAFRILGIITPI